MSSSSVPVEITRPPSQDLVALFRTVCELLCGTIVALSAAGALFARSLDGRFSNHSRPLLIIALAFRLASPHTAHTSIVVAVVWMDGGVRLC